MMINTPASAYVMNAPGPVSFMTTPEPTNRPAPMTPPMAIIVSCRWLSAFFKVGVALMASLRLLTANIIAFSNGFVVGFTDAANCVADPAWAGGVHLPIPFLGPRVGDRNRSAGVDWTSRLFRERYNVEGADS